MTAPGRYGELFITAKSGRWVPSSAGCKAAIALIGDVAGHLNSASFGVGTFTCCRYSGFYYSSHQCVRDGVFEQKL
jgi:hypothetical protein